MKPNQLFLGEETGGFIVSNNSGIDIEVYGMEHSVGDMNHDEYPDFVNLD